jgi:hypothetical protein
LTKKGKNSYNRGDTNVDMKGDPGAGVPGFVVWRDSRMPDITIPEEPRPTGEPLIRALTISASGLAAATIAVNLILQIAHYMKKRPMEPDQRDRLATVGLSITVLRNLPPLIRQARLFADQLSKAA